MERKHPDIKNDLIVLQVAGQLFFLCLTLLSIYFWKERQAFDAAHYLFEIIDRKFFYVAHQRPIGIVSQVLPLIGVWLHLPLKAIAVLYSLGDIIWYYLLFLLMAYKLETRRGIICLLLILSLTIRYSFFCPVTELLQGLTLLPVWLCMLGRSFRFRFPILITLMAIIIFSHPLLFYPLAFTFAWWSLMRAEGAKSINSEKSRLPKILWPALIILMALKFFLLDSYDHDKTFYPVVYNDYGFLKSLSVETVFDLMKVIAANYTITTLLFVVTIAIYAMQRRLKSSVLLIASVLGYLIIIAATHRFGGISNYSERMLLPIPFMIAMAAAGIISLSRVFVPKLMSFVGLLLVLLLHLDVLRITAKPYTLRVEQIESLTNMSRKIGIQKAIVDETLLDQNSFAMSGWSYPIETLLLSALKGPDSCVSVILQHEHVERIAQQKHSVRANEWVKWTEVILPLSELNDNYFKLPTESYLSLNESGTSYLDTVRLQIHSYSKINPQNYVIAFELLLGNNKALFSSDSTYLSLQIPNGPQIRLTIPYTLVDGGILWMEVPMGGLENDDQLEVFLQQGQKTLAREKIKFAHGQFSFVKP
ncbi:MAG: hypothetical protein IPO63_17750 [Bacteroidetes bacterium]|nr:hypothetical protein [Bacteroidota bacterium]